MTRRALPLSLLLLAAAVPVSAATYQPTRFDDPAPNGCGALDCSLREAVLAANHNPGADRIILKAGTYNLTRRPNTGADGNTGALWIRDPLEVTGLGSTRTGVTWGTAISAGPYSGIFRTDNSNPNAPIKLALRNLAVGGGAGDFGGCISHRRAGSLLDLSDVVVEGCTALQGGGIFVERTTSHWSNVIVRKNASAYEGGGIFVAVDADIESSGVRIEANTSGIDGGGIAFYGLQPEVGLPIGYWVDDGTSMVRNNVASLRGGGIAVIANLTLMIDGGGTPVDALMEISGNRAGTLGGGIVRNSTAGALEGSLYASHVRVRNNEARYGGGILSYRRLELRDAEVAFNRATNGYGGGITLVHTTDYSADIERVSLTGNSATQYGGGVAALCGDTRFTNVSMQQNTAASGSAFSVSGRAELQHVTVFDHPDAAIDMEKRTDSSCPGQAIVYERSLLAGSCSAPQGYMVGGLSMQFGPTASACPEGIESERQSSDAAFGLIIGRFGGGFDVAGWNNDGLDRPQRNFVVVGIQSVDVRGQPRPPGNGLSDAGAFEQQ